MSKERKLFYIILQEIYLSVDKVYMWVYTVYTDKAGDFMNIIISNKSEKPIYEQIKIQFKNLIIDGVLKEGDALPGMRTLASDLKVSVITTKRAYNDLEQEGFIYTVPGKGSFVSSLNHDFIYEDTIKKIENIFEEAIVKAKQINISKEELMEILNNLFES